MAKENVMLGKRPYPSRLRRILGNVRLWVALALVFSLMLRFLDETNTNPSPLWFLDPLLLGMFLLGVGRRPPWLRRDRGWGTAVFFIGLSWLAGMLYELSLRTGPTGFGGMHPQTVPSFLMAQGFYVLLAICSYFLIRRYQYTFKEAFFAFGLVALYEMATMGWLFSTLFSPLFFLTPLVIAYYFTVYALIVTWPLLLVDETVLWSRTPHPISRRRKLLYGMLIGPICWIIFVLWSGGLNYLGIIRF